MCHPRQQRHPQLNPRRIKLFIEGEEILPLLIAQSLTLWCFFFFPRNISVSIKIFCTSIVSLNCHHRVAPSTLKWLIPIKSNQNVHNWLCYDVHWITNNLIMAFCFAQVLNAREKRWKAKTHRFVEILWRFEDFFLLTWNVNWIWVTNCSACHLSYAARTLATVTFNDLIPKLSSKFIAVN